MNPVQEMKQHAPQLGYVFNHDTWQNVTMGMGDIDAGQQRQAGKLGRQIHASVNQLLSAFDIAKANNTAVSWSTMCIQAYLLASFLHAHGWKHIWKDSETTLDRAPLQDSPCVADSDCDQHAAVSSHEDTLNDDVAAIQDMHVAPIRDAIDASDCDEQPVHADSVELADTAVASSCSGKRVCEHPHPHQNASVQPDIAAGQSSKKRRNPNYSDSVECAKLGVAAASGQREKRACKSASHGQPAQVEPAIVVGQVGENLTGSGAVEHAIVPAKRRRLTGKQYIPVDGDQQQSDKAGLIQHHQLSLSSLHSLRRKSTDSLAQTSASDATDSLDVAKKPEKDGSPHKRLYIRKKQHKPNANSSISIWQKVQLFKD